ncbi:MAG TPA: response regulator [Ktedonobacteraceae bacterium]|jgi:DNA-binding NtrC family response regulator|nr:response regulator [Ktedonobacteraceae bacterium]
MHISVIEDNAGVRTMVETALKLHGHVVETYANSPSFFLALQAAERTPPYDLVIVDLFLEQQLGTDIVEALSTKQPQVIPTILISAAEENVVAPIRKCYPDLPILRKPFKIQALVSLINKATAS